MGGLLGGGLAAAGGSLSAAAGNMVLMDVVPLSLGIETTGRVMSTVVKRNTAIPCRKSDTFTTEEDWQTEVDVVVYEGERASTDACNELGRFTISGLERAKRGVPQVCVTFDVDANGILSVTALDKVTSAKASVTITSTTARNSPAEVAKMVEEAKRFAAVDDELKRKAEARRSLEDVVFSILDNEDASSAPRGRRRRPRLGSRHHLSSSPSMRSTRSSTRSAVADRSREISHSTKIDRPGTLAGKPWCE